MVELQGLQEKFQSMATSINPSEVTGIVFKEYDIEGKDRVGMVLNLGAKTVACDLKKNDSMNGFNLEFLNSCSLQTPLIVIDKDGKKTFKATMAEHGNLWTRGMF